MTNIESFIFWTKRILIYLLGIFFVSLGIVLCTKCDLGVSPISSLPFAMQRIVPLTFGTLTMIFHWVNILLQYLLARRLWNPKVLLQIPVAVAFGWVINWLGGLIHISGNSYAVKILLLLLSIFFTALGMVFMINMELIQNPPDGTVAQISKISGLELGLVKRIYDVTIAILTLLLDLVLFHDIYGLGIATIVSAYGVGKALSLLQKTIGKQIRLKKGI